MNPPLLDPSQFSPQLLKVLETSSKVNFQNLIAALPSLESDDGIRIPAIDRRESIVLSDLSETWEWEVTSLRELFRGTKQPPDLSRFPEEYVTHFSMIERPLLEYAGLFGSPTDQQMREIYSTLRRRPDGRSDGPLHDFMWQQMALLLNAHVISQAEYEAILSRLERSCKTFSTGVSSTNYLDYLYDMFSR